MSTNLPENLKNRCLLRFLASHLTHLSSLLFRLPVLTNRKPLLVVPKSPTDEDKLKALESLLASLDSSLGKVQAKAATLEEDVVEQNSSKKSWFSRVRKRFQKNSSTETS